MNSTIDKHMKLMENQVTNKFIETNVKQERVNRDIKKELKAIKSNIQNEFQTIKDNNEAMKKNIEKELAYIRSNVQKLNADAEESLANKIVEALKKQKR